jgi:glycosyltransferase involved in cell wall biosynthesis
VQLRFPSVASTSAGLSFALTSSGIDPPPSHDSRPFLILFVGRVETYKGVLDIVSMAERLEKDMPGQFRWKIVGCGAASEALASEVQHRKLAGAVGNCRKASPRSNDRSLWVGHTPWSCPPPLSTMKVWR